MCVLICTIRITFCATSSLSPTVRVKCFEGAFILTAAVNKVHSPGKTENQNLDYSNEIKPGNNKIRAKRKRTSTDISSETPSKKPSLDITLDDLEQVSPLTSRTDLPPKSKRAVCS